MPNGQRTKMDEPVLSEEELNKLVLPSPASNAKLQENRNKALRLFDIGYVIDAEINPATALTLPPQQQGIRSMYTMSKILGREKLRLAQQLVNPIKRLWAVALNVQNTSVDMSSPIARTHEDVIWTKPPYHPSSTRLTKQDYVHFFARVYRCFHHPINGEIDARRYFAMPGKKVKAVKPFKPGPYDLTPSMVTMLEMDWEKDTNGKDVMYYGTFHDAIFEVADIWCAYDSIEEYVTLLTMLWICLTSDGVNVLPLNAVKPFNTVAYAKCEGSVRGPAVRTETHAPVSIIGNSNWFGSVSLPTTFFPPPVPTDGDGGKIKKKKKRKVFSAGIRKFYHDPNGRSVYAHGGGGGVHLIVPSAPKSLEDIFIVDAPGPRSAYFIPVLHAGLLKPVQVNDPINKPQPPGEADVLVVDTEASDDGKLDFGGWEQERLVDGSRKGALPSVRKIGTIGSPLTIKSLTRPRSPVAQVVTESPHAHSLHRGLSGSPTGGVTVIGKRLGLTPDKRWLVGDSVSVQTGLKSGSSSTSTMQATFLGYLNPISGSVFTHETESKDGVQLVPLFVNPSELKVVGHHMADSTTTADTNTLDGDDAMIGGELSSDIDVDNGDAVMMSSGDEGDGDGDETDDDEFKEMPASLMIPSVEFSTMSVGAVRDAMKAVSDELMIIGSQLFKSVASSSQSITASTTHTDGSRSVKGMHSELVNSIALRRKVSREDISTQAQLSPTKSHKGRFNIETQSPSPRNGPYVLKPLPSTSSASYVGSYFSGTDVDDDGKRAESSIGDGFGVADGDSESGEGLAATGAHVRRRKRTVTPNIVARQLYSRGSTRKSPMSPNRGIGGSVMSVGEFDPPSSRHDHTESLPSLPTIVSTRDNNTATTTLSPRQHHGHLSPSTTPTAQSHSHSHSNSSPALPRIQVNTTLPSLSGSPQSQHDRDSRSPDKRRKDVQQQQHQPKPQAQALTTGQSVWRDAFSGSDSAVSHSPIQVHRQTSVASRLGNSGFYKKEIADRALLSPVRAHVKFSPKGVNPKLLDKLSVLSLKGSGFV